MGPKRAGGHGHGGGDHHEERHDDEGPALAHRPKGRKAQQAGPKVVKPGVYIVRHVQSKSCLGVQDGEWEMGEVECRPVNEVNTNPLDLTYERFLVWENHPDSGTWNLLNLRAGAYVIHNAAEKGSKSIRSKATNAQSPEALWDIEKVEGEGSTYRFQPHGDKKHFLSVDDPKDSKSTAILVDPENENKDKGILFKLEATDMGKHKIADWMEQVKPQSTKLSMMSIPGTHQTLALNTAGKRMFNSDNPHCQNLSPYLQLCAGMRFFDLRLNYYDWEEAKNNKGHRDGLIARHGVHPVAFVWEGYSFSALCQSVSAFLEDHPNETVIIMTKQEGEVEGLSPKKLAATFYDELKPWAHYFKSFANKKSFVDLTVEDVAGQAVIFTGIFRGGVLDDHGKPVGKLDPLPEPNNNYLTFWLPHGHQKVVSLEGPPEQLTVSQFPEHAKRMTEFLKKVAESDDPNTLFWLGLNSSGKPAISGAAMGELYNPIDYTKWINKDFLPPHIDEKRHPKGTRMGLVTFDFVEIAAPFVKFLVERNPGVNV